METLWQWMPAAVAAAALLCLVLAIRAGRRQRLIDNLPTSKTTGVFVGLVELKGTAEADPPLTSYLAAVPCVYYSYTVREKSTHTETETYTDSDGRTKTRTVTKTEWDTVAQGGVEEAPFYLQDDRGVIRIQPKGAKIEPQAVFSHTCGPSDPLYFGKCPAGEVANSDHVREFREEAICLQAPLFVVGHARQREDIVAAEIAADDSAPLFLVSTRSEQKVSRGYRLEFWLLGLLGLGLAALSVYLRENTLQPGRIPGVLAFARGIVAYLAAWLLGWIWMVFNSLVELRQRVLQGWANIDVELKRRADLLPNLARLVTGLRDHERRVLSELTEMRAQGGATAPGTPGPDPAALAGSIRAIAEAYPDLKSNDSFLRLQRQLVETEDRISLARNYFNDIATFYNTRLKVFPDGLIAAAGGMRQRKLMDAAGFERPAVQVKLP